MAHFLAEKLSSYFTAVSAAVAFEKLPKSDLAR